VARLLFDIETDGLLHQATKVHCIGITDVDTEVVSSYGPAEVISGLVRLEQADEIIGHNIIRFDIPALKKIRNFQPKAGQKVTDTLIVSRLKYPALKADDALRVPPIPSEYVGKHSLAAWGHRLGEHKGDYSQMKRVEALALGFTDEAAIQKFIWGTFSTDMLDYMMQDVAVNFLLYKKLNPDKYAPKAIELEHRIAKVCDAIEDAGFPFDFRAAGELHVQLLEKQHELETRLKAEFGSWWQPISPDPAKCVFIPKKDNKRLGYLEGYPIKKYKLVEFNPGSRDHIAKVLKDRGWQPTKFTPGGSPLLDEETIEGAVAKIPELAGVGEYLMLDKRLSQLTGSKQSLMAAVQEDGRIHGSINPMGTITGRASHFSPNLAQVPSAKKPYGGDFRSLFRMPAGWKLVGADMQGLELRGLAHYLSFFDGGAYGRQLLEGDPHWATVIALGLLPHGTERDKAHDPKDITPRQQLHIILREDCAKVFAYATVYGAGALKLGTVIHEALLNARNNAGPEGDDVYRLFFGDNLAPSESKLTTIGQTAKVRFASGIEGYNELNGQLRTRVAERGYVKGLDGRMIPLRKEFAALNTLIQSSGAILCKQWGADAYDEMSGMLLPGRDFFFCAWVHDEYQVAAREEYADFVGETLVACAQKAGEPFGFKLRLDSEYSIGDSWADTH
jgi:DNA polymerase I-like protein with 3'-5' exonuclease and polymerase domains